MGTVIMGIVGGIYLYFVFKHGRECIVITNVFAVVDKRPTFGNTILTTITCPSRLHFNILLSLLVEFIESCHIYLFFYILLVLVIHFEQIECLFEC